MSSFFMQRKEGEEKIGEMHRKSLGEQGEVADTLSNMTKRCPTKENEKK